MTLPASGPISIGMVAAELGIALPLSLGDSRARTLAGVASGPISLGQLRGKSAYTSMSVTGNSDSDDFPTASGGGSAVCFPSVGVTGGSGGYSFLWAFTSNPGGCVLTAATSQSCQVAHAAPANTTGTAHAVLQCTVTDNTNHSVTVGGITADLTWAP